MTFVDLVHPEDVDIALGAWSKLAIEALPINCEFRWKWTREDLTDDEKELGGQWVTNYPPRTSTLRRLILNSDNRFLSTGIREW